MLKTVLCFVMLCCVLVRSESETIHSDPEFDKSAIEINK